MTDLANAPKRFMCEKCASLMIRTGIGDNMRYLAPPNQPDPYDDVDPVRCSEGGDHEPVRIGISA